MTHLMMNDHHMDMSEFPRSRLSGHHMRGPARPDFRRFHDPGLRGPYRNGPMRLPLRPGQMPPYDLVFSPIPPMPPIPGPPIGNWGMGPPNGPLLSPPPRPRMAVTKGEWIPLTKLGRLVKDMKIKSLEEVFLYDLPILEPEIFEHFLGITIKEEVLAVVPTDKTLPTGERCVRFKALAVAGDSNGHVGLGVQISKEVAVAIAGACLAAKLNIIPIRRGFWTRPQAMNNQMIDRPHTVPRKVNGAFGSVTVRLVPAPRGSGIGSAPPVAQRILALAGIEDAYFICHGPTVDLGFLCKASLNALRETFVYFQQEVFNITRASHSVIPELLQGGAGIEAMLHHLELNDYNANRFPFGVRGQHAAAATAQAIENERKNLSRRLIEAQIHRDLGLSHPDVNFDNGVFPMHLMQGVAQKPLKFHSHKRSPKLAPIPARKRSLIPIVPPPTGAESDENHPHEEEQGEDFVFNEQCDANAYGRNSPVEMYLNLRHPLETPGEEVPETPMMPETASTWRVLAPAFVPPRKFESAQNEEGAWPVEAPIDNVEFDDNVSPEDTPSLKPGAIDLSLDIEYDGDCDVDDASKLTI